MRQAILGLPKEAMITMVIALAFVEKAEFMAHNLGLLLRKYISKSKLFAFSFLD